MCLCRSGGALVMRGSVIMMGSLGFERRTNVRAGSAALEAESKRRILTRRLVPPRVNNAGPAARQDPGV